MSHYVAYLYDMQNKQKENTLFFKQMSHNLPKYAIHFI